MDNSIRAIQQVRRYEARKNLQEIGEKIMALLLPDEAESLCSALKKAHKRGIGWEEFKANYLTKLFPEYAGWLSDILEEDCDLHDLLEEYLEAA